MDDRRCGATQHSRDRSCGDAPHHQRPCGRPREQVRGQRHERHRAEQGEQQRHDGNLSRGGDSQRFGHPLTEGGREHGEPDACCDRQAEPDRVNQQRVDEDEPGHRQRQHSKRGDRPAQRRREERHARHHDGARHRRLPPGHRPEDGEQQHGGCEPRREPEPPEHRRGKREEEGDVLARDRQQVRQPRRPEVLDLGRVLLPIIAEDHAGEQRPLVVVERGGAAQQQPPGAVGDACDRRAAVEPPGIGHDESPCEMARRETRPSHVVERRVSTHDLPPLTRRGVHHRSRVRTDGHPQPHPVDPRVDT